MSVAKNDSRETGIGFSESKRSGIVQAVMDYRKFITVEPSKRGGKPCVRGLRITVGDVLGWIAAGMSWTEILDDYPDLTEQDIRACLAYAADREQHTMIALTPHEAAVRP
jgi:uncharacterized protein (DUF433 family)